MSIIEQAAILLWHRFSPETTEKWKDETHKAEYRLAAEEVLKLTAPVPVGWRPIGEAPKDGTRILICTSDGQREIAHWQGPPKQPSHWPQGWRDSLFVSRENDVTHFQPLPEPPAP